MASERLTSWEEVGGRVAVARERSGFSQSEVAQRMGLHRSAIARLEQGQRNLSALELVRLSEIFGRAIEWFLTEPPASIASHRDGLSADAETAALEDRLEQLARNVELLCELNTLRTEPSPPQIGLASLDDAELGAEQARRLINIPPGPIHNLQAAVQSLGLLLFSDNLGTDVIDGGYVRLGDVGVALINGSADPGRRRFSAAHELGHHMMADEYTLDFGLDASREGREALINAFAVHFLMPRREYVARWQSLPDALENRQRLIILAAEYRVSWTAAVSHARTLGLVTSDQRELLVMQRPQSADYMEMEVEFVSELEPPSQPSNFQRAVLAAYKRSLITAERAVEILWNRLRVDELPEPHSVPIGALKSEFKSLG